MNIRLRIRCTESAYDHALDLMQYLRNPRGSPLGHNPGDTYTERVAGFKLIANRLRCGGIDIRQVGENGETISV